MATDAPAFKIAPLEQRAAALEAELATRT